MKIKKSGVFYKKLKVYFSSLIFLANKPVSIYFYYCFLSLQKSDRSLLAQFYYADEELNMVAAELDSFDGHKDPERCTLLVNQLRGCQDKVLNIIQKIMDKAIDVDRANRDFRVKFPDDVLQESLAGQLWFGAEVS